MEMKGPVTKGGFVRVVMAARGAILMTSVEQRKQLDS
jgi:hypothetical protein